jgi:hypothetical protein
MDEIYCAIERVYNPTGRGGILTAKYSGRRLGLTCLLTDKCIGRISRIKNCPNRSLSLYVRISD